MISIALCTYNGERFLAEQLASFLDQTRLPDELVVCDDCSTDGTVALVHRFAETAPFSVRFELNPINLGSTLNFAKAIALCRHDLICLADQDDVWAPNKLEVIERVMQDHLSAGFVFTDADMVDGELRDLGYRLFDAIRFGRQERRRFRHGEAFRLLLRRYRVTGATMAFRGAWKDLILPIPREWVHDAWIALLIAALAPGVVLDEPLIRYRQHGSQQLGERKRGLYGQYLVAKLMCQRTYEAVAKRYEQAAERLQRWPTVSEDCLRRLKEKIVHFEQRTRMRDPGPWRFLGVLREVWRGRYFRCSLGWKSIAQDLFLP